MKKHHLHSAGFKAFQQALRQNVVLTELEVVKMMQQELE